jgi:CheY-like chemotaxis protein
MKILLIEDSRFLRALFERTLTKAGYSVVGVGEGEAGIREAQTTLPSLILLDMMLPGMDGPTVLKALKGNPGTASIPVVVLTGLSQRNEARLKQAGAFAYIEKAALELDKNPQALINVVKAALASPDGSREMKGNELSETGAAVQAGVAPRSSH